MEKSKTTNSVFTTKEMVLMAMMAAVTAVCSWISVPAEVPFTLQTFAVFCTIGILGGYRGVFSILVYILLGAVGIPVFSGMKGGAGVLFGATGGYIIGFIFIALVCMAAEKVFGKHLAVSIAAMLVGLLVCYAFGTAWFMYIYTRKNGAVTLAKALRLCVIPFIIPDILKLILAVLVSGRIRKSISV